jgi:hypothetical protein
VAWLKCVAFDACRITASGTSNNIAVTQSYWGVQGWEVTGISETNACFTAYPPSSSVQIHHIIFANNVANGCYNGGFTSSNNGSVGVDYLVIVGNIAYNSVQSSMSCNSGIDIYQSVQSDPVSGTHIYIAGNFIWGNFDGACNGGKPTDGEGVAIDTPDGSQGGLASPYAAQIVIDNNIAVANGGRGLGAGNNTAGPSHANIYFRHNTAWGNNGQLSQSDPYCGEMIIDVGLDIQMFLNLAVTNAATGCGTNTLYPFFVNGGNGTDSFYQNYGYSGGGGTLGIANSTGFSAGSNNIFGTNPNFVNAAAPVAPSCGSATSVPNCMATMIANFTPTNPAAVPYGYQVPSAAPIYDPLFPQWLCNVNLPPGLVTMGCLAQSALPAAPTITGVTVQ